MDTGLYTAMLHITYAPDDADLAERMKNDLAAANLSLDQNILIVLMTPESMQDKTVMKAINDAIAHKHLILPIKLREASLPDAINHLRPVDLTRGYKFGPIIKAVRRAALGESTVASNRRLFFYLAALVIIVFGISIGALATNIVAFPEDEIATENAIRNATIDALTFPTLDPLMPRTTADAMAFPQTVEAANTRNAPLLAATATALLENQQATETAREATQTAAASE